jgi:hypothetical protein
VKEASEPGRRRIVALVFLVFVLLVTEGAIRKWLLPSYGRYLFFIRDPFVIAAYAIALTSGWWPKSQTLLNVGIAFGAISLVLAAVQLMSAGASADNLLLLTAYGWRNYFLYLPLPFVMATTFRAADVAWLGRLILLISVPIAVLVFLQFVAPINSPINVGISDDPSMQFRGLDVMARKTRPMGPFTSDQGQRGYVVALVSMLMALWVMPAEKRFAPMWLVFAGTAAAFASIAVSGSRGTVIHTGIIMCAAAASAVITRAGATKVRAIVWPLVISVVAVMLFPVIFPEAYETFTARWTGANAVELQSFKWGVFGRALYSFVDFMNLLVTAPLLGYGIGFGGNASIMLGVDSQHAWAETDWARHMVDLGPVFGSAFILFRIALVIWMLRRVLVATRRTGDPLPLIVFAFAGVELLQGQITGHGSVNGFTWIFCGFALAAAVRLDGTVNAPLPTVPRRFANLMR